MEFYRSTTVGSAMIATLNELLASGEITNEQALEVVKSFDEKFESTFRRYVPIDKYAKKHEAQGKLVNYNNFEDLWKIDVEDVKLKFGNNEEVHYDRLRLLFNVKSLQETPPPSSEPAPSAITKDSAATTTPQPNESSQPANSFSSSSSFSGKRKTEEGNSSSNQKQRR